MSVHVASWRQTVDPRGEFSDLFLSRLERLVDLWCEPGLLFDGNRLLHHAIYATYMDCLQLGLEQPANALVARISARARPGP